jgi:hypothetical protein
MEGAPYRVAMVQVGRDWLLRIRGETEGGVRAVDVWFAGEGDDAGEVLRVDSLDGHGVVNPPG